MCQTATRAIWFDALCRMHERKQGFVKGTTDQLCRMLRCTKREMKIAIQEIENLGIGGAVMDCNNIVTITSRRKTREFKELELNRLRVNRHRRKAKCKEKKQQCNGPSSYSSPSSITSSDINIYARRIGALFGRDEKEQFNIKELEALNKLGAIPEKHLDLIEKYYTAFIEDKKDFRRNSVLALLQNWKGERDKASKWARKGKPSTQSKELTAPAGWIEAFQKKLGHDDFEKNWNLLGDHMKQEIIKHMEKIT